MKKSIGEIIDALITTNLRCWFAQEDIMNEELTKTQRLRAAVRAQEQNAKRSELMMAIDKFFGQASGADEKSYYTYFGDDDEEE